MFKATCQKTRQHAESSILRLNAVLASLSPAFLPRLQLCFVAIDRRIDSLQNLIIRSLFYSIAHILPAATIFYPASH